MLCKGDTDNKSNKNNETNMSTPSYASHPHIWYATSRG